jgi:hypothetical protein
MALNPNEVERWKAIAAAQQATSTPSIIDSSSSTTTTASSAAFSSSSSSSTPMRFHYSNGSTTTLPPVRPMETELIRVGPSDNNNNNNNNDGVSLPALKIITSVEEYDPTRSIPPNIHVLSAPSPSPSSPVIASSAPTKVVIQSPVKRPYVPVPHHPCRSCYNYVPYWMKGDWLRGYLILTVIHGRLEGFYLGVAYATTSGSKIIEIENRPSPTHDGALITSISLYV